MKALKPDFINLPWFLKLAVFYNVIYLYNLVFEGSLEKFVYFFSVCLGMLGLIVFMHSLKRKLPNFYKALFFLIFLLFLFGLQNGNFISFLYFDLVSFSAFLIIFVVISQNSLSSFYDVHLPNYGYIVNLISLVFVTLYLVKFGLSIGNIQDGRQIESEGVTILSPKELLYNGFFLYPLITHLKEKRKLYVYNFCISLFLFFSLAMAARGTTVIAVLIIISSQLHRRGLPFSLKILLKAKFFKLLFFLVILSIVALNVSAVSSSFELLIERFNDPTESLGSDRTEEAASILKNLTTIDITFGRGLGAANKYWIFEWVPNGVNSVHYGWLFLILKGGVILCGLIYYRILSSVVKLIKVREFMPFAFMLIAFTLLEFAHTSFNSFYRLSYLVFALASISYLKEWKLENRSL